MKNQRKVACLIVESGIDAGMLFPLSDEITTIGRSPVNAIQLVDRKVSRYHAEIRCEGDEYLIYDLGSKNGTYVQNRLLSRPQVLQPGDQIRFGDTHLSLEVEEKESPEDTTSRAIKITPEPTWERLKSSLRADEDLETQMGLEMEVASDTARRLETLYQVAETVRSILRLDELLEQVMKMICDVLHPERGFIMLPDERTGELRPYLLHQEAGKFEEIKVSKTIVDKCVREKIAVLVTEEAGNKGMPPSASMVKEGIRSALCMPFLYKDEVLGVVYIDSRSRVKPYSDEELALFRGICNQAAMAIANARLHHQLIEQSRLEKEMEIARQIQMDLLPRKAPQIKGFALAGLNMPAKKVGGDYYDFIELESNNWSIVIGDVSGKGVPAAILLATVRATLRSEIAHPETTLEGLMEKLNRISYQETASNMFVTMISGILNPRSRVFEYVNAGHCYPILFENDEEKTIETNNAFLGLQERGEFKKHSLLLKPGTVLVLYSDGVVDTVNADEEFYGTERLVKVIKENLLESPERICELVYEDCTVFRGESELFDDFTLVVLKSLPEKRE